jgi:hypothetical protein
MKIGVRTGRMNQLIEARRAVNQKQQELGCAFASRLERADIAKCRQLNRNSARLARAIESLEAANKADERAKRQVTGCTPSPAAIRCKEAAAQRDAAAAAAAIGVMIGIGSGLISGGPMGPTTGPMGPGMRGCPPGMRRSADNPNCHVPGGRR